jgi:hypothetical protein
MPRKSSKQPMNKEEMIAMESKRSGNKLYDDGTRKANLATLSNRIHHDLSIDREKIKLVGGDLEIVKAQTLAYVRSCEAACVLPSFIGLSRALGHSRTSLYRFLELHPDTQIAEFLEIAKDAIADALDSAALDYSVNTIAAIFVLKSIHDRIDRAELRLTPPIPDNRLKATETVEQIQAKYLLCSPEE